MFPPRAIVSHPVDCITLNSWRTCTTQHELPPIRQRPEQAFNCSHRHQHGIFVVKSCMRMFAMPEPHFVGRDLPGRRFVHVVPDAHKARLHMFGIQPTPPVPSFLEREVWKCSSPWPDLAKIHSSPRRFAEKICTQSLVENGIARLIFDSGINDC